ncbi:hypothetical protein F2981_18970 (plasmid) [Sinorhizobium meliloti]|nr:hypothetical protein [Sinorhizobium meliloti]
MVRFIPASAIVTAITVMTYGGKAYLLLRRRFASIEVARTNERHVTEEKQTENMGRKSCCRDHRPRSVDGLAGVANQSETQRRRRTMKRNARRR